jgi:thiosulfate reductase cytochrome b subunit
MRDFFERLMTDDESGQKFTTKEAVVYGIVVPVAFILIIGIAGWMETAFV